MADRDLLTIYTYLMPVLAGLSLATVLARILTIWQKERTGREFVFTLVYVSLLILFVLFSLYARSAPLVRLDRFVLIATFGYGLLALSLALGNYYEWSDLISFLRKKNVEHIEHETPEIKTLEALGADDVQVTLEATTKLPEEANP